MTHLALWKALGMLAIGSWLLRIVGPVCAGRFALSPAQQKWLADATVVLLCALAATSTLLNGTHFAGWARVPGVLAGVALVVMKKPFPVAIIAAAGVTAGLRYLGVA